MVRVTLERQLKEQANEQNQLRENAKKMDKMILEKAQAEMEAEVRKKDVLKSKTLAAKADRDRQMKEYKVKIEKDEREARQKELKEVSDLRNALEKEKNDKIVKK